MRPLLQEWRNIRYNTLPYVHGGATRSHGGGKNELNRSRGAIALNTQTTVHRKKKAVHKTTTTDDKRLQNTLKRLGVNTIPGIEEVNIFKDDDVIHFTNPKGAYGQRAMHACMQ